MPALLTLVLLLLSACGALANQTEPAQQQAMLVVAVTVTPAIPTIQASSTIAPSVTPPPSATASPSASPTQGALQAVVVTAHSNAPQASSGQIPQARVITSAPVQNPPIAEPQPSFQRQTIKTDDGFVAVRAEPSSKSQELMRLSAYTTVSCSHYVAGEYIFGTNQWAYCPSVGGYILSVLLE